MRIFELLSTSLFFAWSFLSDNVQQVGNLIDNRRLAARVEQAIWDYAIALPGVLYWYFTTDNAPVDVIPKVNVLSDSPHDFIIPSKKGLSRLQSMFRKFNDQNGKVNTIYVVSNQSTGKTELARQYGNFELDRNRTSTVIHLNMTSETAFKESLIKVITEIDLKTPTSSDKYIEYGKKLHRATITILMESLRHTLKHYRHNWLLIVDDIRQGNITEYEMYKTLPGPGAQRWGTGRMVVTTRLKLVHDSYHAQNLYTHYLDVEEAKKLLYLVTGRSPGTISSTCIEHIACKLHKSPGDIINVGFSMKEQRILDRINPYPKMPCYPYKDSDIINNSLKVPGY